MKYDLKTPQPLLEAYPDLARYDEFQGDDLKLRFVIALIDEESPAYRESDLNKRCSIASKMAGVKYTHEIMQDTEIERMLCRLFVIQNNHTYELWFSKLVAYGEANHRLRQSITDDKDPMKSMEIKMKVSQRAEGLRTELLKLEKALFHDEIVAKKIKESVQSRTLHYTEAYAQEDTVI